MNTIKSFLLISFLIFTFIISFVNCHSQDDPDAWEKYHNSYQPPNKVLDSLGIKPGMIIAEIGAGRGRYAVHMAKRVGAQGKVFANDIDKKSLDYLKYRIKRDSLTNITPVLGKSTNPMFPAKTIDLVYVINTYHHIDKPVKIMKNIPLCLKPGGKWVIIEHDPEKYPQGGSHTTSKAKVLKEAEVAGFKLIKMLHFLERDIIYIFEVKE
jgi:ubiquinone/menaquinone biosynthesis C-methylase UbiE